MAQIRGNQPALDHAKITRATEPRLRGLVPAIASPIQSANQTLEKVSLTLNRAGTHPGNPILAGLAGRPTIPLAADDTLTGLFIFTDRADPKGNLVGLVSEGPTGLNQFDLPFVEGHVTIGSPATGAKRNYIRQASRAGEFERTFWVQSHDFNAVQLAGLPALDPADLTPVVITVIRINGVDPWLDVLADFFVTWADEFHVEHRSENLNLDPGFAKAYGGVLTVSVFDTTPGTEGVGTEVNPFTELLIAQQKKVEVQNTLGIKSFTFRFRAKQQSPYFVDIPVQIQVVDVLCPPGGDPPVESDNGGPAVYFDPSYIPPELPPTIPGNGGIVGSDPGGGEPIVPYSLEGITPTVLSTPLEEPIYAVTIQAQSVGANPTIIVRRWALNADSTAQNGIKLVFLSQKEYTPLVVAGATIPTQGAPYQAAAALRIGFSASLDSNVALFEIMVRDGTLISKAQPMLGPIWSQGPFLIQPGTGVTDPLSPV